MLLLVVVFSHSLTLLAGNGQVMELRKTLFPLGMVTVGLGCCRPGAGAEDTIEGSAGWPCLSQNPEQRNSLHRGTGIFLSGQLYRGGSGVDRGGHQGIVSTRLWRFSTITTKDSEASGKHKRSIQKSGPGPLHDHEAWGQIQCSKKTNHGCL